MRGSRCQIETEEFKTQRGRTPASEAATVPHSRISVTWQHLRDNASDPVARFQLAGYVQQLRWKGKRVFTEPQGCLITAWKQEALHMTKTAARAHRERQGPAAVSPAWRARLIFASLTFFFLLSFSHSLILKRVQWDLLHTVALPVYFLQYGYIFRFQVIKM